ncbi:MAG: rhomboid family intramembrane serine protease [Bacteroidales bacterium]|nr:rhomboid family intramembrane serine protease [Bacteroidales bacterium]
MTVILVIIISVISVIAFRIKKLSYMFDLTPYRVFRNREYYRILTHAFLHVDYIHLIVNMIVLLSFGLSVESIFRNLQSYDHISSAKLYYGILIFLGIAISTVVTLIKHKDDPSYSSVGASGLVSAIVFTHIFFQPMQKIYFYFAIPIPGIAFGILYLLYSSYMSRRKRDNINHDAHIWGAILGFFYPVIISPELIKFFIDNFK